MIFKYAEVRCILKILNMLNNGKSRYGIMFKETKVSHTTLQSVLRYLLTKKFIKRIESDYKVVDYEITKKGKELLEKLEDLKDIL